MADLGALGEVFRNYAVPAGALLVAGATFWTNFKDKRAQKAKAESKETAEAKTKALQDAKEAGRQEALAEAEKRRHAELLSTVEQANRLMGTPEDMAQWSRVVEQRLFDLDGKTMPSLAFPEISSGEITPVTTPTARRRI